MNISELAKAIEIACAKSLADKACHGPIGLFEVGDKTPAKEDEVEVHGLVADLNKIAFFIGEDCDHEMLLRDRKIIRQERLRAAKKILVDTRLAEVRVIVHGEEEIVLKKLTAIADAVERIADRSA